MMVSVDQNLCPPRYRDPVWVSAGGMGTLYRAVDRVLNRPVAIKLLAERLAADEEVRKRFRREAVAAARLSDEPNTVTIFDIGEWQGRPFIVMEYLGGGTLERLFRQRSPAQAESAALDRAGGPRARCSARSRSRASRRQAGESAARRPGSREGRRLRHCDRGRPRLTDPDGDDPRNGRLSRARAGAGPAGHSGDRSVRARRRRVRGVDGRAALRPRFAHGRSRRARLRARAVREGAEPALPPAVDAVFDRVLAKRPEDRFASCSAFAAALRGACKSEAAAVTRPIAPVTARLDPPTLVKPRRRRMPLLLATGATLALLAGAIAAAVSEPTAQRPNRP